MHGAHQHSGDSSTLRSRVPSLKEAAGPPPGSGEWRLGPVLSLAGPQAGATLLSQVTEGRELESSVGALKSYRWLGSTPEMWDLLVWEGPCKAFPWAINGWPCQELHVGASDFGGPYLQCSPLQDSLFLWGAFETGNTPVPWKLGLAT